MKYRTLTKSIIFLLLLLSFISIMPTANASYIENPIVFYNFSVIDDSTVVDLSPNHINATYSYCVINQYNDNTNYTHFAGATNNLVNCTNNQLLDVSNNLTVEVWFRCPTNSYGILFGKNYSSSYGASIGSDGRLTFFTNGQALTATGNVKDNKVHQAYFIKDNDGNKYVYLDNVLVGSDTTGAAVIVNDTIRLTLGRYGITGGQPLTGDIFLYRMYDDAFNESERTTNYYDYVSRFGLPSASLSSNNYYYSKALGTVNIPVALSYPDSINTTNVQYQTINNGTAIPNTDYTTLSGTITFNPGETSKNISLVLHDDNTIWTSKRTVNIEISPLNNPSNINYATVYVGNRGGIVLSFDDGYIDNLYGYKPTFDQYGVKATFFVIGKDIYTATPEQINKYNEFYNDGYEISSHSYNHTDALAYSDLYGVDAYVQNEIVPSRTIIKSHGWGNADTFAYPLSNRSATTDTRLNKVFKLLRWGPDTPSDLAAFHVWNNNDRIIKSIGTDYNYGNSYEELEPYLERAYERGEVITFYGHKITNDPAPTEEYYTPIGLLTPIFQYVNDHNMEYYTFNQLTSSIYPVANFTVSTTAPIAGQEISLSSLYSTNATLYNWDFGDGTTSTEQNPTHTYTTGSDYTVTLTVSNDAGSSTATTTIRVYGELTRWDIIGGDVKQIVYLLLLIPFAIAAFFVFRMISGEDVDSRILLTIGVLALTLIIIVLILMKILEAISGVA